MKRKYKATFVAFILLSVFLIMSCSSTGNNAEEPYKPVSSKVNETVETPAEVASHNKAPEAKKVEIPRFGIISFTGDYLVVAVNGYNVVLNIDGGTFKENAYKSYSELVASEPSVVPLPSLEKKGNLRNVWQNEKGEVIEELKVSDLSSDIVLKAKWVEDIKEEEVVPESAEVKEPSEVDVPAEVEEPVSATTAVEEKANSTPYSLLSVDSSCIEVMINGYKVTLNLSDGILPYGIIDEYVAIAESNPSVVPLPTLTRSGYEKYSWTDEEGKTVTELDIASLSSDVTFTAHRGSTIKYPLTYDEEGVLFEEKPEEVVIVAAEEPLEPANEEAPEEKVSPYKDFYTVEDSFPIPVPERYGYDFVGWILDGQKSYEADKDAEITLGSTGAKDFVAVWNPDVPTITYILNGGEFSQEERTSFIFGEKPFTIENPVREHYVFVGWIVNGNEEEALKDYVVDTGNAQDITLEAVWVLKDYTIVYDEEGVLFQEKPLEVVPEEKEEVIVPKNPVTYTVEDEFELINTTKYGYVFRGWIENGEPSYMARPIYSVLKGSSGDKVFVAVWSPLTVPVYYNLNGGKAVNRTSYTFGEKAFALNAPVKEHYEFKGWRTSRDEEPKKDYIVDTDRAETLVLEAVWTPVEYEIVYNLNGGVFPEYPENPTSLTVEDDTFTIINPTREGYDFKGWKIEVTCPSYGPLYALDLSNGDSVFKFEIYPESTVFKFSSDTKVGENLDKLIQSINDEYPKLTSTWTYDNIEGGILVEYPEGNAEYVKTYLEEELQASFPSLTIASGSYGERVLTALWEPSVYSITYDRNGIVYTPPVEEEPSNPAFYTVLDQFTIINPERPGYTFLGWIREGETQDKARSMYEVKLGSTGDLSLIPVWEKNVYDITYVMNGGEIPENAPSTFSYGDEEVHLKAPKRENYVFIGWKDSEDASPVKKYVIQSDLDKDLNLEAVWTPEKYYISYYLAGGKLKDGKSNSSSYTIESEDFILNVPERDYYVFKGWKEYGQHDSEAAKEYKVVASEARDLILVAVWEPVVYSISYVDDGYYKYDIVNPTSYTVESEDLYIAGPYKDGYDFLGWVVAGDRTARINNPMVIKSGSHGDLKLFAEYQVSTVPVGVVTDLQRQKVVYGKNGIIRPDWVVKVPESNGVHYAKGYARGSDFYETYLEAVKAAKASYAYWINTNIELTDKNVNNVAYDSKAFSNTISLSSIEVVEYWEDTEGGIWVLVR